MAARAGYQEAILVDMKRSKVLPGGGFLLSPVPVGGDFCPEKFDDEALEIAEEFRRFFVNEVLSRTEEIDAKADIEVDGETLPLSVHLLKQMGELGFLSAEIPEDYDGLGLPMTTAALLSETSGGCAAFAVTMGAHAGIGTLPIVYFGNEEQKQRYLPKLATAELVSCYALTEPGAGSDALSGRTNASLDEAGENYILNGEKLFISNGAWADLAIVFTRIDGLYSALIVDLHSEGVSRGAEEKKMGQLGSSTTSLVFSDVKVPKANLLGELGDASKIALNILNLGRLKLGFGCMGSAKYAIEKAVSYGLQRKQFGQHILSFDMQKGRLAQMVARTYAIESVAYRVAGGIDEMMAAGSGDVSVRKVKAVRRHALESSIAKIYGSEALHFVAQNAVFIHGGYGYLNEYQVERVYRDNIVDMIYEGTNDINRMVIFDDLVRNLFSAAIPFRESVEKLDARIRAGAFEPSIPDDVPEALQRAAVKIMAAKQSLTYALNHCLIHTGKNVKNEQQVMREISDALAQTYVMDSTLGRVIDRIQTLGERACGAAIAVAELIVHEGTRAVAGHTEEAMLCAIEGAERDRKLEVLAQLQGSMRSRIPVAEVKRRIADAAVEAGKYPF